MNHQLSYTFRLDSITAAAAAPGLSLVGVSFEPEFLWRLSEACSRAKELNESGLPVPYIPVVPDEDGKSGILVSFFDADGEPSGDFQLDELRVRSTGAVEIHGASTDGGASSWCRADTSIDEMGQAMQATLGRAGRARGSLRVAA